MRYTLIRSGVHSTGKDGSMLRSSKMACARCNGRVTRNSTTEQSGSSCISRANVAEDTPPVIEPPAVIGQHCGPCWQLRRPHSAPLSGAPAWRGPPRRWRLGGRAGRPQCAPARTEWLPLHSHPSTAPPEWAGSRCAARRRASQRCWAPLRRSPCSARAGWNRPPGCRSCCAPACHAPRLCRGHGRGWGVGMGQGLGARGARCR